MYRIDTGYYPFGTSVSSQPRHLGNCLPFLFLWNLYPFSECQNAIIAITGCHRRGAMCAIDIAMSAMDLQQRAPSLLTFFPYHLWVTSGSFPIPSLGELGVKSFPLSSALVVLGLYKDFIQCEFLPFCWVTSRST